MVAADEVDAGEDDCDADAERWMNRCFAHDPADEDGDDGVDVGVNADLGDADVAEQPIEGDETGQRTDEKDVGERGNGIWRDALDEGGPFVPAGSDRGLADAAQQHLVGGRGKMRDLEGQVPRVEGTDRPGGGVAEDEDRTVVGEEVYGGPSLRGHGADDAG